MNNFSQLIAAGGTTSSDFTTSPARCGASEYLDDASLEAACDHRAFERMSAKRAGMVVFIAQPYVAISHFERLYERWAIRQSYGVVGTAMDEVRPGTHWRRRAQALVAQFDEFCRATTTADPLTCPNGWQLLVKTAYVFGSIELPAACTEPGHPVLSGNWIVDGKSV